jgi:peptidoglycan-associated lipoprotein
MYRLGIIMLSVALLAGCETTAVQEGEGAAVEDKGAQAQGAGAGGRFAGDPLNDPASLLSKRVVYFDFDSSAISGEARAIIEAHGKYLAENPGIAIVLEGHADERGTREYNIALGERRANAVRQLIMLLGSASLQLQTVSYGEEQPAAMGHDEATWQLNRRVELVYPR